MSNEAIRRACLRKNDEFYTLYEDVVEELNYYESYWLNKRIYLCCDDTKSAFWKYFYENFTKFGLRSLTASILDGTCYYTSDGDEILTQKFPTGDITSDYIKQYIQNNCDIVVTNPPFSVLKELLVFLITINKNFLLIGNQNVIGAAAVFPLVKEEKINIGYSHPKTFNSSEGLITFGNILWLTSFLTDREKPFIKLTKEYDPIINPKYDNYAAIEVGRISGIPYNYDGVMGVPITYLNKHNPSQFEIVGLGGYGVREKLNGEVDYIAGYDDHGGDPMIDNVRKYLRVFIKRKNI